MRGRHGFRTKLIIKETFINQPLIFSLIMDVDEPKQPGRIKRFFKETVRVLRITKKPDRTEYKAVAKVTGLGIAVIGLIGFIIFLIVQLLF